ncbi:MAG: hypothetical protein HWD61_02430 [Parachlamydiaceae bacterium]|nr:MAG: hypothetical protein HWD61_02430 [Parachlamydiaceae bacterium]
MQTMDNHKKTGLFSCDWKFYLVLFTFLLGTTSLQANDRGSITNERSRETFRDLQEAIEFAFPGDTLRISGTVRGNFLITKNLILSGHHKATLDGNKTGSVLVIVTPEGSPEPIFVILENLKIQNGFATALGGGGILNIGASVVVNNSEIENNQALLDAGEEFQMSLFLCRHS